MKHLTLSRRAVLRSFAAVSALGADGVPAFGLTNKTIGVVVPTLDAQSRTTL